MPPINLSYLRNGALLCALMLLAACQTYTPQPLDLPSHAKAWRERSPSDEQVHDFAARLAESAKPSTGPFDPKDGLSLDEGEVVALVFNPDLRVARARIGVAKATAEHALLWDDPEVSIDVLGIADSIPHPWVIGTGISFTLPVSGRLEAEKARADAAVYVELDRVVESEWEVRRDLRAVWLTWSAQQLRLEQTKQIVSALDSIIKSAAKLVDAGELVKTEAALFTIEQTSRRVELIQLQAEVAEQEQEMRRLMGLSPDAPVQFVPSISIADADANAIDRKPEDTNLSLARLRREYQVAELALVREIRKQYPDLVIGPQYENDEGQSKIGFTGAIPLPILNANKGGIAEAKAERTIVQTAFETEYERIEGRLAVLRAKRSTTQAHRKAINESLIPLIDKQVKDAKQLVELGEGGSLVLLESLVRAHEAKLKLIDIQLQDVHALNEIQFLLGPTKPQHNAEMNEVKP